MGKISLSNIAEELAIKSGLTREAADVFVHAFVRTIEKGLQEDGMVKIKGLGTFKLQEMSDRSSVDVNTGERITIKGYHKVTFTPDSTLKELVNRPFAHFEPTELNDGYPDEEDVDKELIVDTGKEDEVCVPDATCEQTEPDTPVNASESSDCSDSVEPAENETPKIEESVSEGPDLEIKQKPAPRRRGCLWAFLCLLIISVAVMALIYGRFTPQVASEALPSDTPSESSEIKVNPNLGEELGGEWNIEQDKEVKEDTVVALEEENDSLKEPVDSVTVLVDTDASTIEIVESLQAKAIKDITLADTTDYVIKGTLETHYLKRGETIVQLANTYYGDKRLWPYIVKHNSIVNFNSVAIGQEILIPLLEEK